MPKKITKLLLGIIFTLVVVLSIALSARLIDRENVLERVTFWPDFETETLAGDLVYSSSLSNGHPVLFTYFNTECTFCRAEIADIAEFKPIHEATTMIFVSDEDSETIQQFRRDLGLEERDEFLFLMDTGGEVKKYFGIRSVPATYLYNKDGDLAEFYRGTVKAETLYSRIAIMDE